MPTTDSQIKTMPSGYVVTGTVKDAFDTGLPVVGLQYFFINNESKPVGQIFHSPDGNYSIALPGATDNINFWAPGYEPIVLTAKELAMVNEVLLVKEKKDGIIFPAAALVAIILLYNHAKKKKKLGAFTTQDVMPWLVIVAAFFGFSALRKMLEFLGLAQSKDTAGLDASSTNPGSFWNPNFWKQVLPAGAKYTYALTIAQAQELAKRIYDSTGFLHHDAPAMKAVFKSLQTQANASFLAWVFAEVYGEDLLSWLRGRWFEPYRYSDADVNEVTNFVNNLRKY